MESLNILCPNCGNDISTWELVKPKLRSNRITCSNCGSRYKYNYPLWYLLIAKILSLVVVVLAILVGMFMAVYADDPERPRVFWLAFLFAYAPTVLLLWVGFGTIDAKIRKKYFTLTIVK